jgi:hypothetical protein
VHLYLTTTPGRRPVPSWIDDRFDLARARFESAPQGTYQVHLVVVDALGAPPAPVLNLATMVAGVYKGTLGDTDSVVPSMSAPPWPPEKIERYAHLRARHPDVQPQGPAATLAQMLPQPTPGALVCVHLLAAQRWSQDGPWCDLLGAYSSLTSAQGAASALRAAGSRLVRIEQVTRSTWADSKDNVVSVGRMGILSVTPGEPISWPKHMAEDGPGLVWVESLLDADPSVVGERAELRALLAEMQGGPPVAMVGSVVDSVEVAERMVLPAGCRWERSGTSLIVVRDKVAPVRRSR